MSHTVRRHESAKCPRPRPRPRACPARAPRVPARTRRREPLSSTLSALKTSMRNGQSKQPKVSESRGRVPLRGRPSWPPTCTSSSSPSRGRCATVEGLLSNFLGQPQPRAHQGHLPPPTLSWCPRRSRPGYPAAGARARPEAASAASLAQLASGPRVLRLQGVRLVICSLADETHAEALQRQRLKLKELNETPAEAARRRACAAASGVAVRRVAAPRRRRRAAAPTCASVTDLASALRRGRGCRQRSSRRTRLPGASASRRRGRSSARARRARRRAQLPPADRRRRRGHVAPERRGQRRAVTRRAKAERARRRWHAHHGRSAAARRRQRVRRRRAAAVAAAAAARWPWRAGACGRRDGTHLGGRCGWRGRRSRVALYAVLRAAAARAPHPGHAAAVRRWWYYALRAVAVDLRRSGADVGRGWLQRHTQLQRAYETALLRTIAPPTLPPLPTLPPSPFAWASARTAALSLAAAATAPPPLPARCRRRHTSWSLPCRRRRRAHRHRRPPPGRGRPTPPRGCRNIGPDRRRAAPPAAAAAANGGRHEHGRPRSASKG